MQTRIDELNDKLARVRLHLAPNQVVRLRGIDWFAWLMSGASNAVLLAAETGIAEILLSATELHVLTDEIEAERLIAEELPEGLSVQRFPWAQPDVREAWIRERMGAATIISDRPHADELPLSDLIGALKRELGASELARYAELGALAASAMTEVLHAAQPSWTEFELAGAGAQALLARGLQPALILAVGSRRLPLYRHPIPTVEPLGNIAMLVFCARAHGLYANLTRFVSFDPLPPTLLAAHDTVRAVEGEALARCQPGVPLADLYTVFEHAYRHHGYPESILQHHQGGITGYQAREALARPDAQEIIQRGTALAFNPSVKGAKIEDTFVVTDEGLRNLTFDPHWPHTPGDQPRPLVLQH